MARGLGLFAVLFLLRVLITTGSSHHHHHHHHGNETSSAPGGCTLTSCNGINLLTAIHEDLKPWASKGGITPSDLDEAQKRLSGGGYLRIAIKGSKLYATHLGRSFGTRDGVFLVALMMLMKTQPHSFPHQVEFLLSTTDRTQLFRAQHRGTRIPFALSFAHNPDSYDVAVPDPSFWVWPENLIGPYWCVCVPLLLPLALVAPAFLP